MKIRRWLTALLAVLLLVTLTGLWAAAADQPLDLNRECSLKVNPCDVAAHPDTAKELTEAGLIVDIYKVASLSPVSGYDTYTFSPDPGFDLSIPSDVTNKDWIRLAQQAAKIVLQPTIKTADTTASAGSKVTLKPGLYLLIAHGKDDTDYVETITAEDGTTTLATSLKTDRYQYSFAPELVVLPSKDAVGDKINTANPGEWVYDLEVNLKPERKERKAPLEIVKTLLTYEASSPATFVFQLDWEEDGQHFSDVRSLSFTAPGERTLLVEGLPVGVEVTVTEVYSGTKYVLVSDGTQKAVISAEETARVEFVNDYDEEKPPNEGGSITNKFTYDEKNKEWIVTQQIDSTVQG